MIKVHASCHAGALLSVVGLISDALLSELVHANFTSRDCDSARLSNLKHRFVVTESAKLYRWASFYPHHDGWQRYRRERRVHSH